MSRLPAHAPRYPHLVGGVECSPAPRCWVDGLGVAVLAVVLGSLVPACVLSKLAERGARKHIRVEEKE